MKTIIAGSRTCPAKAVYDAVKASGLRISEVISGCAHGADYHGQCYATSVGLPIRRFPADWTLFGKAAGHIRNRKMLDEADALIAVWDGRSPGTKHMIHIAQEKGIPVYVHYF